MAEIDYRTLLKRYMDNVGWNEGVYFTPFEGQSSDVGSPWTREEVAELESLEQEIASDCRAKKLADSIT